MIEIKIIDNNRIIEKLNQLSYIRNYVIIHILISFFPGILLLKLHIYIFNHRKNTSYIFLRLGKIYKVRYNF